MYQFWVSIVLYIRSYCFIESKKSKNPINQIGHPILWNGNEISYHYLKIILSFDLEEIYLYTKKKNDSHHPNQFRSVKTNLKLFDFCQSHEKAQKKVTLTIKNNAKKTNIKRFSKISITHIELVTHIEQTSKIIKRNRLF